MVAELRDKDVRGRLRNTPLELDFRTPSTQAIRTVSDFARKTGDFATPLAWSECAAARTRQRRLRSAMAAPALAKMAFPWNDACRMAVLPKPPSTRALRHVWNVAHADGWPEPSSSARGEARRSCAVLFIMWVVVCQGHNVATVFVMLHMIVPRGNATLAMRHN